MMKAQSGSKVDARLFQTLNEMAVVQREFQQQLHNLDWRLKDLQTEMRLIRRWETVWHKGKGKA